MTHRWPQVFFPLSIENVISARVGKKKALSDHSISLFPSTEYLGQSISLPAILPQAQVPRQSSGVISLRKSRHIGYPTTPLPGNGKKPPLCHYPVSCYLPRKQCKEALSSLAPCQ